MKRFIALALALSSFLGVAFAFDTRPTPDATDGTRALIDLPVDQHMTNVGGSDGYGLCVPTSVTVAAHWQNVQPAYGFRKFTEGRPGGSDPDKLAEDLKIYSARNKTPVPPYVQHTGGDDVFLDLCFATRRAPCITYAGVDGFYESGILHMVTGAHLDDRWGAIIDNNRAGSWVWMTRNQLLNRWKGKRDDGKDILIPFTDGRRTIWQPAGGGWAFVWLAPPPPPKAPSVKEVLAPERPEFVWERVVFNDKAYWCLYQHGEMTWVIDPEGLWHRATGPLEFDQTPSDRPGDVAAPTAPEPMAAWNQGITPNKISKAQRYWINDCECSRAKAFAAVADPGGLVDDSDKYHLSLVGADAKAVSSWFAAGGVFAKYARRVHVQVYPASDWVARDRLVAVVQLQEPAKIGGKIVGSAADSNQGTVGRVLSDVFDVPVKPETKPEDPKVAPEQPTPAPRPNWFIGIVVAIITWFGVKYTVKPKGV